MKILICGHRAYAAKGLVSMLEDKGHDVLCFSRGELKKDKNIITGNVLEVGDNHYLTDEHIEVIVNFILLDGESVNKNIEYASSLCKLARKVGANRIIHMSSVSCYANECNYINENTHIDEHPELKGYYGMVKIMVDNYILGHADTFKVVMMRPGFIIAKDKKNSLAGIAKVLPMGIAVLMGDKKSTLPIIKRSDLHKAIVSAAEDENPLNVYLLVDKGNNTKLDYLKSVNGKLRVITLNKDLVMFAAKILKIVHVFDEKKYKMVEGLFKVQQFDSQRTLQMVADVGE